MEFLEQVVFIDVGAYTGDSLRRYINAGGDVRFAYLFEPNPHVEMALDFNCSIRVYRKAAWVANEYRPLYLSRQYAMEGSTLFPEKTTGDINREEPIEVECIDFPAWLAKLRVAGPFVLKLNVEGAEYQLVSGLAQENLLQKLDVIYVSLHAKKIGLPPSADVALRALLEASGFERFRSSVYHPTHFEAWRTREDLHLCTSG